VLPPDDVVLPPEEELLLPVVLAPDEELLPPDEEPVVEPDELPPIIGVVHVPWIEPGGAMQESPAQQSAFVVQDWPAISQAVGLHVSCPDVPVGTQGWPLQHSVANEQLFPTMMQPMPASLPPTPV
jgi:hypothetical protein